MQLTQEELTTIAEKASSLFERIEGGFIPDKTPNPKQEKQVEARLKEWSEIVAEGDKELFKKRLTYEGLDLDTARNFLGGGKYADSNNLPSWTKILNEILKQAEDFPRKTFDSDLSEKYLFLKKDFPTPFEEIFLPFVLIARKRFSANVGDRYNLLTDKTHTSLEQFLLQRLTAISSRVLEVEFSTFRACLQFSGMVYSEVMENKNSRQQYLSFVKEMVTEGLPPLFKEYCVLARMLAVCIEQWVELATELLDRLQTDLLEMQKLFADDTELGKVVDVDPGLSDSHCNGRTVIILTFESGIRLVYKPKKMGLEADYFQFADWLNKQGVLPSFKVLKLINRDSYGWIEFAEKLPMNSEEEVNRYYQRSGMLLYLIYICDGIDFHHENVVASGEYPVPIDLETFFHHRVKHSKEAEDSISGANEAISDSVLRTHFLPQLYKMKDKYLDITGLGGGAGQDISLEVLRWKNINTDAMEFNFEKIIPDFSKNAPKIKDEYLSPEDHVGEILDGFHRMHQFLSDKKEDLFATNSLFTRLFQNEARFVFRATELYSLILSKSTHPDYQREGVDLSLQIDILTRPLLGLNQRPVTWPLIREEHYSMWKMDVPKFTAYGDADSLILISGDVVKKCFLKPPFDFVKEKICDLGKKDLEWQMSLIEGSLEARASIDKMVSMPKVEIFDLNGVPTLNKREMIGHAITLAEELREKAYHSKNGEPSWVILKGTGDSGQFMLDSMDFSLYDGSTGVALFLAALDKLAPRAGYRDMAYSTIALMRRWFKKARPSEISELGIGGCSGLGSIVYSLVSLGKLLDDPALLEESQHAASLFKEKDVDSDKVFDVLAGSAGAILGLLACHKVTGENEILQKAVYCGNHLLKNQVKSQSGFQTWNTIENNPLLGFSHGAAGIAYALLKLYQVTKQPEFLQAAQEAIDYETHAFVPEERNWPDLRTDLKNEEAHSKELNFMCAWCHGAPGILLGRIGGLEILDSDSIRKDIQVGLQTTQQSALQLRDHICCGNMGRVEALLTAGQKLSQPQWIKEAVELTSQVAARAQAKGSFRLTFLHNFYNASLFQGTAGVGYQLLRLAEPEALPSLLLLE